MRRLDKLLMYKFTLLLLLISCVTFAQKSVLYNEHRQLIVDTSFHIDEHTYKNLPLFEKEILPRIYNNVRYPARSRYNNINGIVIAKLEINGNSLNFEIVKSSDEDFNLPVLKSLKNLSLYMWRSQFPENEKLIFYMPIKFEVVRQRYQKTLNQNHMITIEVTEDAPEGTDSAN